MSTKFVMSQIQKVLDQWNIDNFIFCGTSPDPDRSDKLRVFVRATTTDPNNLIAALEVLLARDPNWRPVLQAALDPEFMEEDHAG